MSESETDETTTENEEPLNFTELNKAINDNTNSTIYLSHNYKYDKFVDEEYITGIKITRNLTIYGNGITLDGSQNARIFNIVNSNIIVNFHNINFIKGQGDNGGAINGGNTYNCTFTNNHANHYSGAIYHGNAYNSTFTNNSANWGGAIDTGIACNCTFTGHKAEYGGAIFNGSAYNCIFRKNTGDFGGAMWRGNASLCNFNGDTTYDTNITPVIINVLNYTSTYRSGERLKFNLTANNILFDGINTTIKIYQNGSLITTVYGLTGEGWIVDLIPGEYNAVLSLTDFPDEQSVNATITVLKGNTTVVIKPINDVKVGKEITITYTTNSNGTATIKVNEEEITGNKFTPTKEGTYNVIVEVAENEYYTAATNETTFTAEKTNTTVTINPITDAKVGKEITITYTTNSNGTATIKVNNQTITDGKY